GDTFFQIDTNQTMYYSGNILDNNHDGVLNGSTVVPTSYQDNYNPLPPLASPWSSVTATIPAYSVNTAYRYAISSAGALHRYQIDDLVITQVKTLGNGPTGTGAGSAGPDGGFYTSQTQTGLGNNGYGVINGGVLPLDTDGDGMPDF